MSAIEWNIEGIADLVIESIKEENSDIEPTV